MTTDAVVADYNRQLLRIAAETTASDPHQSAIQAQRKIDQLHDRLGASKRIIWIFANGIAKIGIYLGDVRVNEYCGDPREVLPDADVELIDGCVSALGDRG